MAEKTSPTAKELRAAYQTLADQAAEFDRETTKLVRERSEADKKWVAARKAEKAELMAKKLSASVAMNQAEEAQAAGALQNHNTARQGATLPKTLGAATTSGSNTTDRAFETPPAAKK